jgi:hypothetical protein
VGRGGEATRCFDKNEGAVGSGGGGGNTCSAGGEGCAVDAGAAGAISGGTGREGREEGMGGATEDGLGETAL